MVDTCPVLLHYESDTDGGAHPCNECNETPTEQRVAIWSLSPAMLTLYFVIFWVQCVAGIATDAYYQLHQRADAPVPITLLEIVRGSGPTGIGAAVNALVIALFVEATMVLAQIVKRRQFEQGRVQGREEARAEAREEARAEAREEARREHTEQLEAWAKEKDIPLDDLPKLRKPKSKRD